MQPVTVLLHLHSILSTSFNYSQLINTNYTYLPALWCEMISISVSLVEANIASATKNWSTEKIVEKAEWPVMVSQSWFLIVSSLFFGPLRPCDWGPPPAVPHCASWGGHVLARRGRDGDIYLPEAPDGAVVFGGFFDRTDCLSCLKMFQDSCKICQTFSIY